MDSVSMPMPVTGYIIICPHGMSCPRSFAIRQTTVASAPPALSPATAIREVSIERSPALAAAHA